MVDGAADLSWAARWSGPLHSLITRQGDAAGGLHHVAGLLHAASGDDASLHDWLPVVAAALGADKVAYLEFEIATDHASRAVSYPAGDAQWCQAIVPLAEVRSAHAGEAIARGNETGNLYVAAVKCVDDTVQVVALAHDVALDARQADARAQALTTILWHLHCLRGRTAVRGLNAVDLLALLPLASSLTDGAGRAIERNEAFAQFMEAVGMRITTGRLRFDDPYLQDSWQVALGEVLATAVPESMLTTAPGGGQWRVHLLPLRCALDQHDTRDRPMVLAIAEQLPPSAELALEAALANAVRPLTPAESDVLNALLQGHTAKIIANARGASVNTVRSQIMAILDKTGHHTQKGLMAAFGNSSFGASGMSGMQSSGHSSTSGRRR